MRRRYRHSSRRYEANLRSLLSRQGQSSTQRERHRPRPCTGEGHCSGSRRKRERNERSRRRKPLHDQIACGSAACLSPLCVLACLCVLARNQSSQEMTMPRILIVDDEPSIVLALKDELVFEGFEV